MTVIYEATEDRPHFCTTANASLPVGSICQCDCGRFWLRKTVIGDYWVYRWVPVRWYHRAARRRIKEWVRQKNNGDFRFPMTSLLTAAPPQTLTNKTIQDYGANLLPVGEPRLTINGEPLTREAAEMLAKLYDTVPGEGWREGDRPGGETPAQTVDEAHRLADIDLTPNPFRRTGTDAEKRWQQADDRTPTKFRVTVKFYPSPFAAAPGGEATWTGTKAQVTEMAGEFADDMDNPLLHMEIDTVEVLDE